MCVAAHPIIMTLVTELRRGPSIELLGLFGASLRIAFPSFGIADQIKLPLMMWSWSAAVIARSISRAGYRFWS